MAQIEIDSFFTSSGVPDANINTVSSNTYPQVRIWQTNGTVFQLIVGSPNGTGQNTNGFMKVVENAGQEDGFYSFLFTSTIGFDPTQKYLIRIDGGPSLTTSERFQAGQIDPASLTPTDIANVAQAAATGVLDTQVTSHLQPGSVGAVVNQTSTLTQAIANNLYLNVNSVLAIVGTILQNQQTKNIDISIDPVACTLTVTDRCDSPNNFIPPCSPEPNINISMIPLEICEPCAQVFPLLDISNNQNIVEAFNNVYP